MAGHYPEPALRLPIMALLNGPNDTVRPLSSRKLLSRISNTGKQTSIHHLLGSFYSYIWVGTPPQRVSVIIDTGSHYTAFPCEGCKCGIHMDPYFDPSKSSSSVISRCSGGSKCFLKQSYSEGSSWHAYKVRDKLWLGGETVASVPNASNLSTYFDFGCQDMETGLFRTQQVDGIMGLSGASDTYPHVLHVNGVTKSKVFAMCFRKGGGILTVGGVDSSIHSNHSENSVVFAKQVSRKVSGWFAVRLLDVLLRHSKTKRITSIGVPFYKYNTGKGVIIDSGTTDTYLPASAMSQFLALFKQMSGIVYTNNKRHLSLEELESLPTIIYRLEGIDGKPIDIESPPSSYTESIIRKTATSTSTKHAFRIYLTEPSGTVLGANFMVGHNVIFDYDARKIGFAKSECDPAPMIPGSILLKTSEKTMKSEEGDENDDLHFLHFDALSYQLEGELQCKDEGQTHLATSCTATCSFSTTKHPGSAGQIVTGEQKWSTGMAGCHTKNRTVLIETCSALCTHQYGITRSIDKVCPVGPWSPCQSNCTQSRIVSVFQQPTSIGGAGTCMDAVEFRNCESFNCPRDAVVVTLGVNIKNLPIEKWSYVHKEDLLDSLSLAFRFDAGQFHLYSGPVTVTDHLALEVKLRLTTSKYGLEKAKKLGKIAVKMANKPIFPVILSLLLNGNSTTRYKSFHLT